MANLGERHKRRILASFQHADELLSRGLYAAAKGQTGPQSHYIHDLSPSELLSIESHAEMIREQMRGLLQRFQISLPEQSTPSSWILKTSLTSLDIILEDLYPQKMRGYGEMDPVAAGDLTQTLHEMRKLIRQMLKSLK